MKRTELRIGNYVFTNSPFNFEGLYYIVDLTLLENFDELEVEAIPITKEWLLKFGFELDGGDYIISISDDTRTVLGCDKKFNFMFMNDGNWCFFNNNKPYIHELQNLYFVLTGKELTI